MFLHSFHGPLAAYSLEQIFFCRPQRVKLENRAAAGKRYCLLVAKGLGAQCITQVLCTAQNRFLKKKVYKGILKGLDYIQVKA